MFSKTAGACAFAYIPMVLGQPADLANEVSLSAGGDWLKTHLSVRRWRQVRYDWTTALSVRFNSDQMVSMRSENPYALSPVSQKSPQHCH